MQAVSKYVRTNKYVRDEAKDIPWIKLLSGHGEECVESCCCPKVPHPELACGTGKKKSIPLFHAWHYIHGTYPDCGVNKNITLISALS